ncbi:MAG: hypothetical protein ABR954_01765 [Dehalococcoidales bacterium]
MYKKNELFETPPARLKIWRYLDFIKFFDLLERSKLFFTRLDKLEDPFEGVISENALKDFFTKLGVTLNSEEINSFRKYYVKDSRIYTAVSCWHLNTIESDSMWKSYIKNGDGLAIQSTVKRLETSLIKSKNDIFVSRIIYENKEFLSSKKKLSLLFSYPAIFKGKEYKHDEELRAIIQKEPFLNPDHRLRPLDKNGIYVDVKLNVLIAKIILAPKCDKWKSNLIEKMCKKHGLDIEIVSSSLDNKPIF